MTDQLRLFRGPLIPFKRLTIKVEEGGLYSDQRGTAIIQFKDDASLLAKVLYIPGLDVNLLSGKRLCRSGLRGSFDTKGLYMNDKQRNQMLKGSSWNGIYIVDKIDANLEEFELMTAMKQSDARAMSAVTYPTKQPEDKVDAI